MQDNYESKINKEQFKEYIQKFFTLKAASVRAGYKSYHSFNDSLNGNGDKVLTQKMVHRVLLAIHRYKEEIGKEPDVTEVHFFKRK